MLEDLGILRWPGLKECAIDDIASGICFKKNSGVGGCRDEIRPAMC